MADTKLVCLECVCEAKIIDFYPNGDRESFVWAECHDRQFMVKVVRPSSGIPWPAKAVLQQLENVHSSAIDYASILYDVVDRVRKLSFVRRWAAANGHSTGFPGAWTDDLKNTAEQNLEQLVSIVGDLLKKP